MCLSVGRERTGPCKNGGIDRDAVCGVNFGDRRNLVLDGDQILSGGGALIGGRGHIWALPDLLPTVDVLNLIRCAKRRQQRCSLSLSVLQQLVTALDRLT